MRGRAVASLGLAVAAIGAAGAGWSDGAPELTATDAVVAADEALRGAGVEARVAPDPVATIYTSRTHDPIDVWAVRATVRSEPIVLRLTRVGAHPVAIDDRALDGSSYVLSVREFESVAANVDDPTRRRIVRRNVALTVGAVLVVALCLAHAAIAPAIAPAKEEP